MKEVLKSAGHELKLMFCSPVAWLLLVILLYQFCSAFADFFSYDQNKDWGYTVALFGGGLFPRLEGSIYPYIPLLTMGLMSQELSTGSIKLLFSAPVKTSAIVLGKYFGTVAYWMIVIGFFILITSPSYFLIKNIDMGIVLPGLLAIFLLVCTYSALGLFFSCLTTYQAVAALSTLTALAALNYVGGLWQGVPVIRDVVNFLHIAGHAENLNMGYIRSKDILYYIIVTVLFLGLAVFYMEDMIQYRPKMAKLKRYVFFTVLTFGLGVLFSMRGMILYLDATATKFHTINPQSQQTLANLKGPVSITAYSNLFKGDMAGMPEGRVGDLNFWEPYIRFLPQLELKYVNYYDSDNPEEYMSEVENPARMDSVAAYRAAQHGWYIEDFLTPKQIRARIDLRPEGLSFVRQIEYGKKKRFLRVFNDFTHIPLEQEIMTAFNGLLTEYPQVAFLKGHYERSIENNEDRAYRLFGDTKGNRGGMPNLGFDVRSVLVKDSIPGGINALVIAEPLTPYTNEELDKIKEYIDRGGNLLVTGGPESRDNLNPVLKPLGINFKGGQLMQRNPNMSRDVVFTHTPLREKDDLYPFQFRAPIGMPAAIAIQYRDDLGFKVEEAVVTYEQTTWNKMGEFPTDTTGYTFNPEKGDDHQQLPVAVSLTREVGKKEQRILVAGNGKFMANDNLVPYTEMGMANEAFARRIFQWLGAGKYPMSIPPLPEPKDKELSITKEKFAPFKVYYTWVLPSVIFVLGAVLLLRRRRR